MAAFEYTSRGYRIALEYFEGYTEEELHELFRKNTVLEAKRFINGVLRKSKLAYGLIAIGLVFLVAMILLMSLWQD